MVGESGMRGPKVIWSHDLDDGTAAADLCGVVGGVDITLSAVHPEPRLEVVTPLVVTFCHWYPA